MVDAEIVAGAPSFQPRTFIRMRSNGETSFKAPQFSTLRNESLPVGSKPFGPLGAQSPRSPLAKSRVVPIVIDVIAIIDREIGRIPVGRLVHPRCRVPKQVHQRVA